MTGNNILLDTNIISAWLKGDKIIADRIDAKDEVYIPVQVLGELYYGAQYSLNVQYNISNISRVTSSYRVLNTDLDSAVLYGIIKADLRKKGKPIPENDIWIASIAQQHGLTLITRDKHLTKLREC